MTGSSLILQALSAAASKWHWEWLLCPHALLHPLSYIPLLERLPLCFRGLQ